MGEQDKDTAIFGECKWTNENVDVGILETLKTRSELFNYRSVQYYLFSKKGFTKGCRQKAENMGNVILITYAEMLKTWSI